tara:strand:+ start:225 stop:938 length:714 start_codon:yes stop_codon:yes gene_type:complete
MKKGNEGIVLNKSNFSIKWLFVIAFLLVIIVIGIFFTRGLIINKEIKEVNVDSLKFLKCLSGCEYVEIDRVSSLSQECLNFCENKFSTFDIGSYRKYVDKLIITSEYLCTDLIRDENKFKNCMNDKIEEYSHVVDLSNFTINYDYQVYEAEVINLYCYEEGLEIDIDIDEGAEEVMFELVNENHEIKVIFKESDSEKLQSFVINYEDEGILGFDAKEIELNVKYDGRTYRKGKVACA